MTAAEIVGAFAHDTGRRETAINAVLIESRGGLLYAGGDLFKVALAELPTYGMLRLPVPIKLADKGRWRAIFVSPLSWLLLVRLLALDRFDAVRLLGVDPVGRRLVLVPAADLPRLLDDLSRKYRHDAQYSSATAAVLGGYRALL